MKSSYLRFYDKSPAFFKKGYGYAFTASIWLTMCLTMPSLNWALPHDVQPMAKQSPECLSEAWTMDTIPPVSLKEATPISEAQQKQNEALIFGIIDSKPQFEGGETALLKYIATNVRYPSHSCVEGKVITQFIVDEKGNVSDEKVVRGIGGGADEEALRVVKMTSGKWKPAMRGGVPIKTWFTLPVGFKLDSATGALAPSSDDQIFRVVEEKPEFEGGDAAFLKYIAENIQYPVFNRDSVDLGGKIIVQFVIDENGNAVDAKMIRSVSKETDQQMLQAVKNTSGKWKPGKMHGQAVKVLFTLPMNIRWQ